MQKIVDGTAPDKFTNTHFRGLGFKSSNDQAVIPLLKDLGFLTADGTPTQRYSDYRDRSRSKMVMAEALRETYSDIFHLNERPADTDRDAIHGKFKSTHNVSDAVADKQTMTFLALLKLSDLDAKHSKKHIDPPVKVDISKQVKEEVTEPKLPSAFTGLRYNIEIHLPATKDVEVFNAIFKSLKENLIED